MKRNASQPSRIWLFLLMGVSYLLYAQSQHWIGSLTPSSCLVGDRLQDLTVSVNRYLHAHERLANGMIILYSLIGGGYIFFFFFYAIWKASFRFILPLFAFFFLRQMLQLIVSFPVPEGIIWHYPGVPSLFTSYSLTTDFYFSAYIGITLLAALEFMKYRVRWLTVLGILIVAAEIGISTCLRIHYLPDIYTSIMTAIFVYLYVLPLAGPIDTAFHSRSRHPHLWVGISIVLGIIFFYTAQHCIGLRTPPICGIDDLAQEVVSWINQFAMNHPYFGNALLIALNGIQDALVLFIFALTLYTRNVRPFLLLALFMFCRQALQVLVSMPIPNALIWRDPGFPSLTQSYFITNDFYFSGHTGTALIVALEIKNWSLWLAVAFVAIQIFLLLTLRAHFTPDIVSAILTVFNLSYLANLIAPALNRALAKISPA